MILHRWQIRSDDQCLFVLTALDVMDLAAAIHQHMKLDNGMQVRLQLNQSTLTPTGRAWVCAPNGTPRAALQVIQLGDTTDRLAA